MVSSPVVAFRQSILAFMAMRVPRLFSALCLISCLPCSAKADDDDEIDNGGGEVAAPPCYGQEEAGGWYNRSLPSGLYKAVRGGAGNFSEAAEK